MANAENIMRTLFPKSIHFNSFSQSYRYLLFLQHNEWHLACFNFGHQWYGKHKMSSEWKLLTTWNFKEGHSHFDFYAPERFRYWSGNFFFTQKDGTEWYSGASGTIKFNNLRLNYFSYFFSSSHHFFRPRSHKTRFFWRCYVGI